MMKPVGVFKATLLLQLIPQPCLPALCCPRPARTTGHSLSVGASHRSGSHQLGMGERRPALCCLLPAAQRVKHVYKLTKLAPGRSAPAAHLAAPPPCSLLPPPCLHHQAELARSHKLARPSLPVFIRSHERQLESVSRLSAVGLFQAGLLLQLIPQPRLPALSAASALPAQPFKPEGVG